MKATTATFVVLILSICALGAAQDSQSTRPADTAPAVAPLEKTPVYAGCGYSEVDPLPSREVSTDKLPSIAQIVTNRSCLYRQHAHVSRRRIMVTAIQTQRKRTGSWPKW